MPPKLSSAERPRRTCAAAGTSIPRAIRKSNHDTPFAAATAAVSASPSTKALTSPEPSQKLLNENSSIIKSSSDQSAVPNPLTQSKFSNLEKTVAGNLGLVKPGNSVINGTDNADTVTFVEPEKACSLEIETVVGSGHGVTSEHILAYGQDERSFGPTDGPESRESGVVVPGYGKKKIVKRTVRVVRRVIRKRVPKRVLMDGSENQGNGVILNEVSENLNLGNDFMESSNLDAMEKCDLVNEMNDKSNTTDEVTETSNFNIDASVLGPVIDKRCNDLLAVHPIDMDKLKGDDVLARGGTLRVPDLMEVEKVNSAAESTLKCDWTNVMDDPIIVNVKSAGESAVRSGLIAGVEAFVIDKALEENLRDEAKSGDADEVIDQMVHSVEQACNGLLEDQNEPLMGNTSGGRYEGEVKISEDVEGKNVPFVSVEGKNVPFNKGLLLSGELEALERRKRRKTEIFVGGLNKDAKEDDLWKVFGAAGEILQVRLAMNNKTGKNKGFAFVRFATAADAKNALEKYSKVKICGNQCDAAPVEGNDTIFLGNIDRKWKTEDVVRFLEKAGVDKIEVVTLKTNPKNMEKNRGFAFVEFETNKDAQIAFHKIKKDDFGQNQKIKIAWAQPLTEPSEEEILNVKSVYAEYLPPSWDEEKVKEHFKRFGEIENIVLAKDLASSKRKDFAFINYSTRDGALACVEAVSRESIEHSGSKVKIAVSLANPIPKSKQQKPASESVSQQFSLEKPKVLQATMKFHDSRNKGKAASSNYDVDKYSHRSTTTDELVQILRQQASGKYVPPRPITARNSVLDHFPLHGSKRPLSLGGTDRLFLEPRALPRARIESYSISDPSALSHGVGTTSFPYHHQVPGHTSESAIGGRIYPRFFQTREQAPYNGNIDLYRRY